MPVFIGTSPLDDDDQVTDLIGRAAEGNESAAWLLIHQIKTALQERRVSGPLFDHAAGFFSKLLDLHEEGRGSPRDLLDAFQALHLVRRRGQPQKDDDLRNTLIARVILLTSADYPVDVALNALDGFEGHSRGEYQSAYYQERGEPGGSLKRFAIQTELEVLAGVSRTELIYQLKASGALP